ncbi:SPOR domain-containing protein [bacterium]|nr:SPOR domain-containing protein [bacterium]MBU1991310.1 SPOR domain-containing protein [bacterium]
MEEKNELNDIILNKGATANGNKKIVLAVATLGVILIVVVMLMNSLTSGGTDNLPQAILPPEPKVSSTSIVEEEPLFEEVEVIEVSEEAQNNDGLDKIAQKLKEESKAQAQAQAEHVAEPVSVPKAEPKKQVLVKKETPKTSATSQRSYYIQVGSFSKYEPDKKFLKSITDKGFTYKYHKVVKNSKTLNKVLVGPFQTEKDARNALRTVRSSIEAGAFITKH